MTYACNLETYYRTHNNNFFKDNFSYVFSLLCLSTVSVSCLVRLSSSGYLCGNFLRDQYHVISLIYCTVDDCKQVQRIVQDFPKKPRWCLFEQVCQGVKCKVLQAILMIGYCAVYRERKTNICARKKTNK